MESANVESGTFFRLCLCNPQTSHRINFEKGIEELQTLRFGHSWLSREEAYCLKISLSIRGKLCGDCFVLSFLQCDECVSEGGLRVCDGCVFEGGLRVCDECVSERGLRVCDGCVSEGGIISP